MAPLMDERRCTAKSKQSGQRCKRAAIRGGWVCAMHGGKTPVVAAAAQRRLAAQGAEGTIRNLWTQLGLATPVTDPVLTMQQLAGSLQELVDGAGLRMESSDEARALFTQGVGHLRQLLVDMQRLGLAEREAELEQAQAARVLSAFAAAVEDLDPATRGRVVDRFLAGIGRPPPEDGPVVRGELG